MSFPSPFRILDLFFFLIPGVYVLTLGYDTQIHHLPYHREGHQDLLQRGRVPAPVSSPGDVTEEMAGPRMRIKQEEGRLHNIITVSILSPISMIRMPTQLYIQRSESKLLLLTWSP